MFSFVRFNHAAYNQIMQLSEKQNRFVSEYLVDLNGAGAAVRAGFSKRSARQIASQLLSKHDIRTQVQKKPRSGSRLPVMM